MKTPPPRALACPTPITREHGENVSHPEHYVHRDAPPRRMVCQCKAAKWDGANWTSNTTTPRKD